MTKKSVPWIVTASVVCLLVALAGLANLLSRIGCAAEPPFTSKYYQSRAIRVKVEPWRGRHQVYGVFAVPLQYRRHRLYTAKLRLEGFNEEFPEISPEAGRIYDTPAEPGHYIMRVNFSTRTALWYILLGRFRDLAAPCHWWLIIDDRIR